MQDSSTKGAEDGSIIHLHTRGTQTLKPEWGKILSAQSRQLIIAELIQNEAKQDDGGQEKA